MDNTSVEFRVIADIRTPFPTKFGIPRQAGLAGKAKGKIIFRPSFRSADALRGLDGYSHIWLIWMFSESESDGRFRPTVRPPRLGGNTRMGVFATRSTYRPNPVALSCVKIESIEYDTPDGPVINVSGCDLMDGTPIFDIKPYLPFTDCRPDAKSGFAGDVFCHRLDVIFDVPERDLPEKDVLETLCEILAEDPRPSYQDDSERVYGFEFDGYEIGFCVDGQTLTVKRINKTNGGES